MDTKRIAVWSGGGAKGLIQISCAAELEKKGYVFGPNNGTAGYDLFVCASVGSINGLLMSLGYKKANEILQLYPALMDQIFKRRSFLLVPIYDRTNFVNPWMNIVPAKTLMKECKIPTIITSVEACEDITHFFKSWEPEDGNETVLATVVKSFAAPYFFGQINDSKNRKVWYDGGCGSYNLPIDEAWEQALLNQWYGKYNIEIHAFGTGYSSEMVPYETASKDRWLRQTLKFLDFGDGGMARSQSRMDNVNCMKNRAKSLPCVHFRYFDIRISESLDKMDDLKHKQEYIDLGKKMALLPLIDI
jgi:patatin-like phospholipase/acyl hydrolase